MRADALREPFDRGVDPVTAWTSYVPAGADAFWLDSSDGSGRSYLGLGAGVVTDLAATRSADGALAHVGWLTYEGDAAFLRVERLLEFDHASGAVTHVSLDGDAAWISGPVIRPRLSPPLPAAARWRDDGESYRASIAACQAAITEGDAYQLCLTTSATVEGELDELASYLALRTSSPTHHGGLLRIGGVSLLSASPEVFLRVRGGIVESRPIKGTRARLGDDAAEIASLRADEKERAENTMIVDLVRNDLSRVCEIGSVEVPGLLEVESYAQVHQLVSTVRGRLRAGCDAVDAVESAFPAGSMTGTPKGSAMRILAELEGEPRGLYSGVFGWLGADGDAELAMVIRSIVVTRRCATVGAGGGITALSDPTAEWAEVLLKARAPLAALGVLSSPRSA